MSKSKYVVYFGLSIALYVVLGMMVKIPLIANIGTDLGYVVFGFCCYMFGWPAFIIGVVGCLLESLLINGWIPIGWMLGQAVIGIWCGWFYSHRSYKWIDIMMTVAAVFVGVAMIKTGVECVLYSIPIAVKFPRNLIAFVADVIPMLIGLFIGYEFGNKIIAEGEG